MKSEQPFSLGRSDGPFADEPPPVQEQYDPSSSDFDARRQGVEIRLPKHYDRGSFKVLSGEPGHAAMLGAVGLGASAPWSPLVDAGTLDPISLLSAVTSSALSTGVDSADGRAAALGAFYERPPARASIDGLQRDDGSTELLSDVHARRSKRAGSAVADSDRGVQQPSAEATIDPAVDCSACEAILFGRAFAPSEVPWVDVEVLSALCAMNPSRDSEFAGDSVSLSRGFTYDSPTGVDSIAFGDRTRR